MQKKLSKKEIVEFEELLDRVDPEVLPNTVTANLERLLVPISNELIEAWQYGNLGKVKKCIKAINSITNGARRLVEKQLYNNLK